MIKENFDSVIGALGKNEAEVITLLGLDPAVKHPPEDDSFWYIYTPEKGAEFAFDAETSRFVEAHLTFRPTPGAEEVYDQGPVLGVNALWSRTLALQAFGPPIRSTPPGTIIFIGEHGGSDTFALADHPDLELVLGYTPALDVAQLNLIHKDRPI